MYVLNTEKVIYLERNGHFWDVPRFPASSMITEKNVNINEVEI